MSYDSARVFVLAVLAIGAEVLALAGPCRAETARARAEGLLGQGNRLHDQGKYQAALEAYRQALRLYPSYKIELNLALTLKAMDRPVEAAEHLERFVLNAAKIAAPRMVDLARRHLAGLRARLARLTVTCAMEGASVVLNGVVLGRTPLDRSVYLRPGRYSLRVEAPGYRPFSGEILAEAADQPAVFVSLVRDPASRALPAARDIGGIANSSEPSHGKAARRATPRVWTWVAAGGAAASLAAGVVLGILARSDHEAYLRESVASTRERFDALAESGPRKELAANVMFGVTGALTAASVILFLVEPRASSCEKRGLSLAPALGPGFLVESRF